MGHTHRYSSAFKKKKSGKESQSLVSRPGLGSDPPIGLDRDSGRDRYNYHKYFLYKRKKYINFEESKM